MDEWDSGGRTKMNLSSIGTILAIVVLVLAVVLVVLGQVPPLIALMLGLLAVARLVP